jgi:hypothetical protein
VFCTEAAFESLPCVVFNSSCIDFILPLYHAQYVNLQTVGVVDSCAHTFSLAITTGNFSSVPDNSKVIGRLRLASPFFAFAARLNVTVSPSFLLAPAQLDLALMPVPSHFEAFLQLLWDVLLNPTLVPSMFWINLLFGVLSLNFVNPVLNYHWITASIIGILFRSLAFLPSWTHVALVSLYYVSAHTVVFYSRHDQIKRDLPLAPFYVGAAFILASFVWLFRIVPWFTYNPIMQLVPVAVLLVVLAGLATYGYILAPIIKFSLPTLALMGMITVYLNLIEVLSLIPLLYCHQPLGFYLLPWVFSLASMALSTATPIGVFYYVARCFLVVSSLVAINNAQLDPYQGYFQSAVLPYALAFLAMFLPVTQELFVRAHVLLGNTRPDVPFFRVVRNLHLKPIYILVPVGRSHFLFRSLWNHCVGAPEKNSLPDDLNALMTLYGMIWDPLYLFRWIFFFLFISFFVKPEARQAPEEVSTEVSIPNKLSALRQAFPRTLTVHKYLDSAPPEVIHSLYSIHITGTSASGPAPVVPHTENPPPPPSSAPDPLQPVYDRLRFLEEIIASLPAQAPPQTFKSSEPPSPTLPKKEDGNRPVVTGLVYETVLEGRRPVPQNVLRKAQKSFVSLQAENRSFHGIRLATSRIATVFHGMQNAKTIKINGSKPFTPPSVANVPEKDLTLINLAYPNKSFLTLAPKMPQIDDTVHLFCFNGSVVRISGTVLYSDSTALITNLITKPGVSGAAILNDSGELVAMHQASDGLHAVALPASALAPHLN